MSLTDRQILTMLDLRDNEGWTSTRLAERFGMTRSAVSGLLWRIDKDTRKTDAGGHLNGTLPRKWWAT